jgi:hypothetical protein
MHTKQQEFWHDDVCLDLVNGEPDTKVKVYSCHGMGGNQRWSHAKVIALQMINDNVSGYTRIMILDIKNLFLNRSQYC